MKLVCAAVLAPLAAVSVAGFPFERRAAAADAVGECISASTEGQTLRKEGKLLAARDRLVECERVSCPGVVRTHCANWVAEVEPLIPSVVVRAQDAHGVDLIDAHLTIDGKPGKLDGNLVQLDPGTHTVMVEARDGGGQKVQKVLLASGEHARLVVVRFDAPPAAAPRQEAAEPPPPAHHVSAGVWVLGGTGLAALGAGVYFIVAATSDRNQLAATCAPYCASAATQPGRTDVLAGDVLFAVGGTALGAALIWAFAFPETNDSATATSPRFVVSPVAGGAVTGLSVRW